jgi:uncharacterized membrane protein
MASGSSTDGLPMNTSGIESEPKDGQKGGLAPVMTSLTADGSRLDLQFLIFLIVFSLVLTMGALLFPDQVWDQFLWKYFAGPIEADAKGTPVDGISEGYNPVNTLCYGLILAGSVYWIYRFLDRKNVSVDERFAIAIIPYVLLGSILRVLEDARFFTAPARYLMISPLIYLVVGLFTIFLVYLSVMFRDAITPRFPGKKPNLYKLDRYLDLTWFTLFGLYGIVFFFWRDVFTHFENPLLALFFTGTILWIIRTRITTLISPYKGQVKARSGTEHTEFRVDAFSRSGPFHLYLSGIGWYLCAIFLYHLAWWGWHEGDDLHLIVIPGILILTLLCWRGTLFFLSWLNMKGTFSINTGIWGLNSLMILSQFLDGAATYTGLDFYGYREKHVLPAFLIDLTGTAIVMLVLKFGVLILTIYLLDIEYRKEMQEYPRLCGLIKIVVIILGLAPGTRDLLRLALGT